MGGCGDTQLLILSSMRLMLCRTSCPIREDMVAEGLEIKLPFPGVAEYAIPVCFVEKGYRTTSAAHILVACTFGNVD